MTSKGNAPIRFRVGFETRERYARAAREGGFKNVSDYARYCLDIETEKRLVSAVAPPRGESGAGEGNAVGVGGLRATETEAPSDPVGRVPAVAEGESLLSLDAQDKPGAQEADVTPAVLPYVGSMTDRGVVTKRQTAEGFFRPDPKPTSAPKKSRRR